jgi:photosystem II stability/assembly factor-like uncharacterized protein
MLTIKKYTLLSAAIVLFFSCKKGDPNQSDTTTNSKSREIKGIEIIKGNNQLAYKNQVLDTIVFKVKLNTTTDESPLQYYTKMSGNSGSFNVLSQVKSGDDMIIKVFWQPNSTEVNPTIKFYVGAGCTNEQFIKGTCKTIDSVSLSAKFRQPWRSVYYGNQGGYNVLQDFQFIDEMNGLVVGEGSGTIRTNDGGKTWIKGEPVRNDNSAYLISFTGKDTAMVSIVNNYASFTNDRGKTFAQPSSWTPPFVGHKSSSAYYLQSRDVIHSVGLQGGIAKTTNGGKTWDKTASFNILNSLTDLTHVGNDTLFTCGSVGFIARTTDAGKTWKQQPIQLNNNLNKVYFVNNKLGYIGGQYGTLIRTNDAGEHWDKISTGMSFSIIAIRFFKNHGLIVSSGGEIAESKDSGLSWTLLLKSNYGAGDLRRAIIKDETNVFGLQQSSILTYDITQP